MNRATTVPASQITPISFSNCGIRDKFKLSDLTNGQKKGDPSMIYIFGSSGNCMSEIIGIDVCGIPSSEMHPVTKGRKSWPTSSRKCFRKWRGTHTKPGRATCFSGKPPSFSFLRHLLVRDGRMRLQVVLMNHLLRLGRFGGGFMKGRICHLFSKISLNPC